jgi:cytochrome c peroxidase
MIKHIAWVAAALLASHASADTPADFMARYAQQAGVSVSALSPTRGEALYRGEHPGRDGKPGSCTSCHTANPKGLGKTRVGKPIEPLAPIANPQRFTDAAQVEKWFRRNCADVLARECTPQEKGDFIAWLQQLK